jgi:type I restriction enzyme M protein
MILLLKISQDRSIMTESHFDNIEKIENDLWDAVDELRANSKLASSEYYLPVLGIIFLQNAANRFDMVTKQIEDDQASGKMPRRAIKNIDYLKRGALWLPEIFRWQYIVSPPDKTHDFEELGI